MVHRGTLRASGCLNNSHGFGQKNKYQGTSALCRVSAAHKRLMPCALRGVDEKPRESPKTARAALGRLVQTPGTINAIFSTDSCKLFMLKRLSTLIYEKDRDRFEQCVFDTAAEMGYQHVAYFPIAPLLQRGQLILNFPEAFNALYNQNDWFGIDVCFAHAQQVTSPFYLSDILHEAETNFFKYLPYPQRFFQMVRALQGSGITEVLYVPLPADHQGIKRLVMYGGQGKPETAAQELGLVNFAYTLHQAVVDRFDDAFQLPDMHETKQILFHLSEGRDAKELSEIMGLTYDQVRERIKKVQDSLGCEKRSQVVRRAFRLGLLDDFPNG